MIDPASGLAVLCDGVGYAVDGGQAARLAARTVRTLWRQTLAGLEKTYPQAGEQRRSFDLETSLRHLLEETNKTVRALDTLLRKRAKENDDKKNFARTTLALALLLPQDDGYLAGYAHIGDSRVYLLREQRTLERLTIDDGYFEWKIGKGELNEADARRIEQASSAEQLSEQDRAHFEQRNGISQDLGKESITPHVGQVAIHPGDCLLLTSDGIHDNLTDAEIEEATRPGRRTTRAKTLLTRAVKRSQQEKEVCLRAKKDDMSVIAITCYALPTNRR